MCMCMCVYVCMYMYVCANTLQFQIIVPPHLLIFGFFIGPPISYLDPPAYSFSRFHFADISEIVKTDCSICETVSSLV